MKTDELPRSIVVAVVPTARSDAAIRTGLDLASRLGVEVDLVHAVDSPDYTRIGFDPARAAEITAAIASRARVAVNAHVRALLPADIRERVLDREGVTATATRSALAVRDRVRIVCGPPAKVLIDAAGDGGWIVLGAHKKRGLFELGRTARHVLAKARSGVWVQNGPSRPITRILAPVDLSEHSLRALASARALAHTLGAKVHAMCCFDTRLWAAEWMDYGGEIAIKEIGNAEREDFERILGSFDWQGVEHSQEFVEGEPISSILDRERDADLVMVGTHGRTGLAAALLGGVAYAVVRRATGQVLVIPDRDRMLAG